MLCKRAYTCTYRYFHSSQHYLRIAIMVLNGELTFRKKMKLAFEAKGDDIAFMVMFSKNLLFY